MTNQFDEDYYLNGIASKKSLYSDYRWLPELTIPMVETMIGFLDIDERANVHDFGCARGYLVKAFRELGINASGCDISDWAISNCDPSVKDHVKIGYRVTDDYDWIIAKDVMEHIGQYDLRPALENFADKARVGVFLVVPLSPSVGDPYSVPEYEKDVTHKIRWPLWRWSVEMHNIFGDKWEISSRYRVEGIKDNYAQFARGNGFITARPIAS